MYFCLFYSSLFSLLLCPYYLAGIWHTAGTVYACPYVQRLFGCRYVTDHILGTRDVAHKQVWKAMCCRLLLSKPATHKSERQLSL
jgi:hypothetical protein